jgi:hypothetical protein
MVSQRRLLFGRELTGWRTAMISGAGIVVLSAFLFLLAGRHSSSSAAVGVRTTPVVANVRVTISTDPSDAKVTIDGHPAEIRAITLAANSTHEVTASKLGYKTITVQEHVRSEWTYKLEPTPIHLRVFTADARAKIFLDGSEIGQDALPDYELAADGASHRLTATGSSGDLFTLQFQAIRGERPRVAPTDAHTLVVSSSLGPDATVYSGSPGQKLVRGVEPSQIVPPQGLDLHGLTDENSEIKLPWQDASVFKIEHGNNPVLYVALKGNPTLGYILAKATPENATVAVDDVPVKPRRNGGWFIKRPAGTYTLKVTADGYEDHREVVALGKGEVLTRQFGLVSRPRLAVLSVDHGPPGAELLVDGRSAGRLDDSGALRLTDISPGRRDLELRKPGHESKRFSRDFLAGQTISLGAADTELVEFGTVIFQVLPVTTKVQCQQGDRVIDCRPTGAVSLPPGKYHIVGYAEGFLPGAEDVVVAPSKPVHVNMTLIPVASAPPPAKSEHTGTDLFRDGADVALQNGWLHVADGKMAFLRPGLTDLELIASKSSTSHLWFMLAASGPDQVVYEFTDRRLVRTVIAGGKRSSKNIKTPKDFLSSGIRIHLEKNRVLLTAPGGATLDDVSLDTGDFAAGGVALSGATPFMIRTP